ncbi:MAG TPA: DUF488 domain-containing protein [Oligoflexus sp.]|uniref:DUF488 domain-containing protein n=1 Tax=Oligoflexus sp. TaxID=1971216 RepID=UPI002D7EF63D|nr:DUF488 domain-containing protein [Oligoflexus sp.]HET9236681.1 DUF488 domain-containing protein [Oligoflexus sp.]
MQSVFTIGHSNRELAEFLELLKIHGIDLIVDVRKMPRSRTNPQFNGPELAEVLQSEGRAYAHLESLTGFRRGAKLVTENAWENKSFQAFASYMETPEFAAGLETLMDLATEKTVAVMCSEAVWWRCHRRMIADAMLARGWEVRHILSKSAAPQHELSKIARVYEGRVTYPPVPGAPVVRDKTKVTRGAPKKKRPDPSLKD